MARYARLPFLLLLQHSLSKANPLASLRRPAASSRLLQDLSKTVVTKTVVTTITTQTQETKTVVTKEKPAEDPEVTRFDNDSSARQSMAEGSTSMAEVLARSRAAPREEVETIQFPASPSAYFRKETHGDTGMLDENLPEQNQMEQASDASARTAEASIRTPDTSFLDLQEKHEVEEKRAAQRSGKRKILEAPFESKQLPIADKVDPLNSDDAKASRWQSLISVSAGSQFAMLPAACRLLFFLIGLVIVVLTACGCASAALLV